jgi:predicted MFS family arabinose efflux permease
MLSLATINATGRSVFSQEIVRPRWRTTTSAIVTIGLAAGWSLSAAVGGYVVNFVGYSGLFYAGAGLLFAAAAMLLGYWRWKTRRAPVEMPAPAKP